MDQRPVHSNNIRQEYTKATDGKGTQPKFSQKNGIPIRRHKSRPRKIEGVSTRGKRRTNILHRTKRTWRPRFKNQRKNGN